MVIASITSQDNSSYVGKGSIMCNYYSLNECTKEAVGFYPEGDEEHEEVFFLCNTHYLENEHSDWVRFHKGV